MVDRFDELLKSAGKSLGIPLHTDKHHACAIQVRHGIVVQLQSDVSQEKLLIASKVAEITPGKFRENVLREALKANGMADPRVGVFAYLSATNHLVLFQYYPFDLLTGERLANMLGPFTEAVEAWHNAIVAGRPAPPTVHPPGPHPFGLRP
ncbi:MAG: CesT family type III secretion system chaperone [Verrucomicrobiota bacterium]|nr:CesT family type III secretion system chaperone [Verrucomicrobiota bacterium]